MPDESLPLTRDTSYTPVSFAKVGGSTGRGSRRKDKSGDGKDQVAEAGFFKAVGQSRDLAGLDAEDSSWMRDEEEQIRRFLVKKSLATWISRVSIISGGILILACFLFVSGSTVLDCTPDVCSTPTTMGVSDSYLAEVTFVLFVTALILAKISSNQGNRLGSRIYEVERDINTAIETKCPICKKLSGRKYVGRELLTRDEHLGSVVDPVTTESSTQVPLKDPKTGLTTYETSTSYSTSYVPRTAQFVDEDYELGYECKFCKSTWKEPKHSSHEV